MALQRVLFVCIHNSARSQMAEAWLNRICAKYFEAHSAGLEPGLLNPLVVEVMQEKGVDISQKKTQSVFDVWTRGERFDYVITVCDEASAQRCPVFPGFAQRLHWSFKDPSKVQGAAKEEKLVQIRAIRDAIQQKVEAFCALQCAPADT